MHVRCVACRWLFNYLQVVKCQPTFLANPNRQRQKCCCFFCFFARHSFCATAKNTHSYPGGWSEMFWLLLWECRRARAPNTWWFIYFPLCLAHLLSAISCSFQPRPHKTNVRFLARENKINSRFSRRKLLPDAPFQSLYGQIETFIFVWNCIIFNRVNKSFSHYFNQLTLESTIWQIFSLQVKTPRSGTVLSAFTASRCVGQRWFNNLLPVCWSVASSSSVTGEWVASFRVARLLPNLCHQVHPGPSIDPDDIFLVAGHWLSPHSPVPSRSARRAPCEGKCAQYAGVWCRCTRV